MDHVFAKVKGKALKSFFKVISNQSLFDIITISIKDCIPYIPDHNLDDDSWFKIEKFTEQVFCIDLLKIPFDSKDYDDISKDQFSRISFLFCVQGNDFYFQKITPSQFIHRKFISFGEIAELEKSENRLVINDSPDAVYFKNSDTLIFKNLATISSIFNGVDTLYKDATDKEVKDFLNSPFIDLPGDYGSDTVSKPNRKRISLVIDTLSKMSEQNKKEMHEYINEYCKDKVKYDSSASKYEISTDDELKYLLYGIEQRFYTTPFSKEKRMANSIVPL